MKPIECEIRSFLTEEQYRALRERLKSEVEFFGEDEQVTYYLDAPMDLRIQRNNTGSKIWWKQGAIHDEFREETEVHCAREDFEKLEKLFLALGCQVAVKWFRTRLAFRWNDIDVSLDSTKGYGYILELEKLSSEAEKEETIQYLKEKLGELGIPLTSREEFEKKYAHYKAHWQELV